MKCRVPNRVSKMRLEFGPGSRKERMRAQREAQRFRYWIWIGLSLDLEWFVNGIWVLDLIEAHL